MSYLDDRRKHIEDGRPLPPKKKYVIPKKSAKRLQKEKEQPIEISIAEEIIKKHTISNPKENWERNGKFEITNYKEAMIEFAKLHVQAALKAALESIPCLGSSTDIASYDEVEKEVLNAYPENLIQ
jgi:hypothetical protein